MKKRSLPIVNLQDWYLFIDDENKLRILGKVYGHPKAKDGQEIVTQVVKKYSEIGSYAITSDIFYNLEEPKYKEILVAYFN
jgi:hypothetical protein